jgi:hypothetical protein
MRYIVTAAVWGVLALSLLTGGCSSRGTTLQSATLRSRQTIDYLLDNPRLAWSRVELSWVLGESSPSDEDTAAFYKIAETRPVPEAVRTLLKEGSGMEVAAFTSSSDLGYKEAKRALGGPDSALADPNPTTHHIETWYRYGAVDVGVDRMGRVTGLRVDVERFRK